MKTIIPAILTNDPLDLESKLKKIQGLTDWVQIDIMDGKFVDNISVQLKDLAKISLLRNFSLEIHLMVFNPQEYFKHCQKIKAKRVMFHVEAVEDLKKTLKAAKKFDFQIGIALNPETKAATVTPYLLQIEAVLLLAVRPGFQGQKFIPSILNKIEKIKRKAPKIKIGIDGGINASNIKKITEANPDYLVVGNWLFKNGQPKERLINLIGGHKIP